MISYIHEYTILSKEFGYNTIMAKRKEMWFASLITMCVVIITTLPYLYAAWSGGSQYNFGGFLMNPYDGNSYLAKMYQGWSGNWRFTLPFTANAGQGAYLFLFYLGLGHLSRLFGFPLLLTFHLTRMASAMIMGIALYQFFSVFFSTVNQRLLVFTLAVLGSGLGWLATLFGLFTADFWVAEAYPFLSAYSNPHFPLGIALLVWILTPERLREFDQKRIRAWQVTKVILTASVLGIIQPFGVVIAAVVLGGMVAWEIIDNHKIQITKLAIRFVLILVSGGIPLLYAVWVTQTDPVFSGWNAQNLTPAPPPVNITLSFFPVLIPALLTIAWLVRSMITTMKTRANNPERGKAIERYRVLLVWSVLGLILLYLPFGLQRRFMMGLYIPLAGLAIIGIEQLVSRWPRYRFSIFVLLFFLSIPTNIFVLMAARHGAQVHDPMLYLSTDELRALEWINLNTPTNALVLAGPDTGLFIPAHTGRRVIYGHPFETVDALVNEERVVYFFQGKLSLAEIPAKINFIFVGPRELALGNPTQLLDLPMVYQYHEVIIYQVKR